MGGCYEGKRRLRCLYEAQARDARVLKVCGGFLESCIRVVTLRLLRCSLRISDGGCMAERRSLWVRDGEGIHPL